MGSHRDTTLGMETRSGFMPGRKVGGVPSILSAENLSKCTPEGRNLIKQRLLNRIARKKAILRQMDKLGDELHEDDNLLMEIDMIESLADAGDPTTVPPSSPRAASEQHLEAINEDDEEHVDTEESIAAEDHEGDEEQDESVVRVDTDTAARIAALPKICGTSFKFTFENVDESPAIESTTNVISEKDFSVGNAFANFTFKAKASQPA